MKHLKLFEEFYLGTDEVIGVEFKLKRPIKVEGKDHNTEDTWIIDKAIDDAHYCRNLNTGEEVCFHTDIILGDSIMSESDRQKFC